MNKYNFQTYFNTKNSYDGKEYICKTCHSKVIKGKLPCHATVNDMNVDDIPAQLASLEKTRTNTNSSTHSFSKDYYNAKRTAEKD